MICYHIAGTKTYKRQEARRRALMQKLFTVYAKEALQEYPEELKKLSFYVFTNISGGHIQSARNRQNEFIRFTLSISLLQIKSFVKLGFNDGYYKGRKALLDKYVLHNRHNALRLVLLHELKHLIDTVKYKQDV